MGRISVVGVSGAGLLGALTVWLLTVAAAPAGARAGAIIGTVTTQEAERPALRATIDPAVCGSSLPDESLVRDAAGHLGNVVIAVPGTRSLPPVFMKPGDTIEVEVSGVGTLVNPVVAEV